jgi:hypothetical protein
MQVIILCLLELFKNSKKGNPKPPQTGSEQEVTKHKYVDFHDCTEEVL